MANARLRTRGRTGTDACLSVLRAAAFRVQGLEDFFGGSNVNVVRVGGAQHVGVEIDFRPVVEKQFQRGPFGRIVALDFGH